MRITCIAAMVGALSLAACNDGSSNENSVNVTNEGAANEAQAETPPANGTQPRAAVGADRPPLTRDFLVGNWAEEDCASPDVRLNEDGSTEGGTWAVRGSQLIRTTPEGEDPPLDVAVVDADHFQVSFAGLPPQTMKRCP